MFQQQFRLETSEFWLVIFGGRERKREREKERKRERMESQCQANAGPRGATILIRYIAIAAIVS